MKITFEREKLESAVNDAMCSVSDKNTIPSLEGIRFKTDSEGSCTLTSYDLEKGFCMQIECDVERKGNYIINAAKLNRIVKCMPDRYVTIEIDEKKTVSIVSGRSRFELHAIDGDSFPNLPELSGEKGFTVAGDILKKMINQVFFAIAVADQRPMLCGAYFTIKKNSLRIVSCDGNRLAIREKICEIENKNKDGSDLDISFIIPGRTLSQLMRLISDDDTVNLYLTRKHVIIKVDNKIFFSRLIDSEYIDYNRVIPEKTTISVIADRMELLSCLERASLVTEDKALGQTKSCVKCDFSGNTLKVSSVSVTGSSYDEIAIKKEGDDLFIGFNCKFFLDAVRSATGEKIKISMISNLMSIMIEPLEAEKDENYLYLVCPVKMKE